MHQPAPPVGSTVAVIVRTFDDSRFLADALRSVQQQTHPHWRCVVVDDASNEASWPIVKHFAANDSRFVYLRLGRHVGMAAARNTALAGVTEDFVQFLEADHMLTPSALDVRLRAFAPNRVRRRPGNVAGVYGRVVECPGETTLHLQAVLLRTSVARTLGGFDEAAPDGVADGELWHRLLRRGFVMVRCREVVGGVRRRRSTIIRDRPWARPRRALELLDAANHAAAVDPDVGLVAETAADVAVLHDVAIELERAGHRVAAIDIDHLKGDEGASAAWAARGIQRVGGNAILLGRSRPRIVLARRPSGPATRELLASLQRAGTVCRSLSEPPRGVELAEADSTQDPLDPATVADLSILLDETAIQPDRAPFGPPAFLSALRQEESEIDAISMRKLRALRDAHAGETAIIIGNGPSLNETDLSLLQRAPTFAVNSVFLAGDRLPAPPTYYVVEDTTVFAENRRAIKDFKVGTRLFPNIYRRHFSADEIDENTIFFRMNQGFYRRSSGAFCHPRFSVDASQRVFCGQSVTVINFQLAYWMGFARVVLIGMDFSYVVPDDADVNGILIRSNSDDPNHFHPDYFGAGKTWKDPKLDRVLASYSLAKEMFEADGREIVNATVGGKLELFDRIPLADALPA